MSRRRKRRSKRSSTKSRAATSLMVGMAFVMLIFTLALVIPVAVHQRISLPLAGAFALLMWGASLFALWACLHSRRRRYSRDRDRYTTRTDYSDFEDEPLASVSPPISHSDDPETNH